MVRITTSSLFPQPVNDFHRRWIINQRGSANVVPSSGDSVYGFVYELSSKDEQSLDGYEGVPHNYDKNDKKVLPLELISDGETEKRTIHAMVYIDRRTSPGVPAAEYIHRLNMAIKDGLQKGIPQSYFDKYFRPSVPIE